MVLDTAKLKHRKSTRDAGPVRGPEKKQQFVDEASFFVVEILST